MSRIKQVAKQASQQGRKLLIPYLVAGDPDLSTTLALMHVLVDQGADIIELGIPFSDPSSDGPVIQRGVERALSKGVTLQNVLNLVAEFRQSNENTPIVLMGYLNPIEIMGYASFVENAASAGVDGVLVVDMPTTESEQLHGLLQEREIDTIYLVAPTTRDERLETICSHTSGYLYYVSLKGVTGAALTDYESVAANIAKLRERSDLPIVIGFGIKDADSAKAMGSLSDGVIIGSALVEQIAKLSDQTNPNETILAQTTDVIKVAREALDSI
ncbi:MAG: tryptophan synthase subunit alpha [SAR86 cluster bacterium]|uniref:Tryptophan synthase alpha chain n=1 Tax=SAR86 cluster bacterium TaxID=2030880 RepID=A0A2A5BBE9_9GAMM|nr:MAG: tryptophan synthase subunit alpha [SAR86 cluster bacterium]